MKPPNITWIRRQARQQGIPVSHLGEPVRCEECCRLLNYPRLLAPGPIPYQPPNETFIMEFCDPNCATNYETRTRLNLRLLEACHATTPDDRNRASLEWWRASQEPSEPPC